MPRPQPEWLSRKTAALPGWGPRQDGATGRPAHAPCPLRLRLGERPCRRFPSCAPRREVWIRCVTATGCCTWSPPSATSISTPATVRSSDPWSALLPCDGAAPRAAHRRLVQEIGAYAHTISAFPLIAAVGSIAAAREDCWAPGRKPSRRCTTCSVSSCRPQTRPRPRPSVLFEDYRVPPGPDEGGWFHDRKRAGRE